MHATKARRNEGKAVSAVCLIDRLNRPNTNSKLKNFQTASFSRILFVKLLNFFLSLRSEQVLYQKIYFFLFPVISLL